MMVSMQVQQVLNLLLLVLIAYFGAYLYLDVWELIGLLSFAIVIEHLLIYIKKGEVSFFSFSSITTAFGISLMMIAESGWIYLLIITLGLAQKHFLTLGGRHFFNPSNFALIMALLLFYNDAHIVLGQLGDDVWLRVVVLLLGLFMLSRAQRFIIPIVFTLAYLALQYLFIVSYDVTIILEDITLRFYSVSFLLFILFMLTDPRTTPSPVMHQIGFAILLAVFSTWLDRVNGFRVQHLFMALFFLSPAVTLFSVYQKGEIKTQPLAMMCLLIPVSLVVLAVIENNAPYYFEMDGQ